ncbi:tetratricopeptide repeat protein [Gilvimarinus agarilyticus]|uniref:tetratricopeptide repeat protein n=1 Tax=Gilvimarinus agarilyticus TaxID=679259 RepID=UPI0006991EEF|nr:tetratricopeptide repeat protein [Gilvimarinus agarilyticus]
MRFANKAALARLLWASLLLGLIGCASQSPEPAANAPDEINLTDAPMPGAEAAPRPAILPPGPITQNPYLTAPAPAISPEARETFKRAREQMRTQRWGDARHTLQALVVEAPNVSGPWLNLGIVWLHLDKPGQARAAFERALAANSLNVDAYNQLAALERRAGNFAQADSLYTEALTVWPYSADTHCNQGMLYDLYMGRWSDALAHYEACGYLREQQTGELDNTVNGWIIDLKRRIAAREANG